MATETLPAALSVDEVRRLINAWCDAGFLRVKGLGDKAHLEDIVPRYSYTAHLTSQYETRTVSRATVAYSGGAVDDFGTPPAIWDIPARRPTDFEKRAEKITVPHTERVQSCSNCGGDGTTTCSRCQGWGKVTCSKCNGKGYVERTKTITNDPYTGNMTNQTEMVRENCSCFGGKTDCSFCHGRGKNTCGTCSGSGRVKTYDVLTVDFHSNKLTEVLDATGVPDHLLTRVSGETQVDDRCERFETGACVTPEVDSRVAGMIQKSQAINAQDSRLLFQHLRVERVGVQEVVYRYYNSPTKRMWIYGSEQAIYAPGAPRAWGKLLAIAGGVLAVVAAVILALILTR